MKACFKENVEPCTLKQVFIQIKPHRFTIPAAEPHLPRSPSVTHSGTRSRTSSLSPPRLCTLTSSSTVARRATLVVGNVLRFRSIPEGAVVCNVEHHVGDRGVLPRASGDYVIVISHNPDNDSTSHLAFVGICSIIFKGIIVYNLFRLLGKASFGAKKIVPSGRRAMVGQVAGGGRTEKPLLKAGNAYHKFRVKRNCWPKVRGVAMNPQLRILMEEGTTSILNMQVRSDVTLPWPKGRSHCCKENRSAPGTSCCDCLQS
ncbi:hypothetical protein FNV43_RR21961 [Rhamnella rubrinervis]|uniref:Large ribosomal subunit protein uL2 C-terminal domain-containing protein n=1 Tax=Rhamnella rubrinervis TaxID=2594499 RepID=A0A8K0GQM1_9ROSA|nr:hypothetical protein FNV43_RR21961 [Rhamnella rubrinervis]